MGEGTVYAEEYGEPVEFRHVDMVVNAMGVRSYSPLREELEGCGCKVVVVGDAASAKNGYRNIREASTPETLSDAGTGACREAAPAFHARAQKNAMAEAMRFGFAGRLRRRPRRGRSGCRGIRCRSCWRSRHR